MFYSVYGKSSNPYHAGRTPGGSSGGEGSIIAAAGSVIGVGSDVGGSIRIPSYFCGIFGHKPSSGVVSNFGQLPRVEGDIHDIFLTTGPMCRYASDLVPMIKVMGEPEKVVQLNLDDKVDLKKLRIYYMTDNGGGWLETAVDKATRDAQHLLIGALENSLGVRPQKVDISEFKDSFLIWAIKMKGETEQPSCAEMLGKTGEYKPWVELGKWLIGKSNHTLPVIMIACTENWKSPAVERHFLSKFRALEEKLDLLLGDDGVLIYPTHPTTAPYHNISLLRPFNCSYTSIFNVLGIPSTQVPLGLNKEGLPLGVQLVTNKNMDKNSLGLAVEVERLMNGWISPSEIKITNKDGLTVDEFFAKSRK